jgi:putative colanic acid biosynthesis acetyltransferase WcaF
MNPVVDLSKFNNDHYQPGSRWKRGSWYIVNAILFDSWIPFYGIKRFTLRLWGAKIGRGVIIKPKVNIKYPWKLSIGDHTWIGERVWIDNLDQVDIGKNCCLSQGAMLLCGNHRYDLVTFDLFTQPIKIEDGAWIGAQSTILPGTHVCSHAVIQAGITFHGKAEPHTIHGQKIDFFLKKRNLQ